MSFYHKSVLLNEAVDSLNINPNGIYLDATAGGGGHSEWILKHLTNGRLIALDQDPDAIKVLKEKFKPNPNVTVVKENFCNMPKMFEDLNIKKVDGILLDIGVSSHQLDNEERGFSYHGNADLDMRMSQEGPSAKDVVNTLQKEELTKILYDYADEKYARSIAQNIITQREIKPIATTFELVEIIKKSMPAKELRRPKHPAKKPFQAIRIYVNRELEVLDTALDSALEILKEQGRLCVITFHSLEDKLVKDKFKKWLNPCICPNDFPQCTCNRKPKVKILKSIKPTKEELLENKRSKSAKLRVCEKI